MFHTTAIATGVDELTASPRATVCVNQPPLYPHSLSVPSGFHWTYAHQVPSSSCPVPPTTVLPFSVELTRVLPVIVSPSLRSTPDVEGLLLKIHIKLKIRNYLVFKFDPVTFTIVFTGKTCSDLHPKLCWLSSRSIYCSV